MLFHTWTFIVFFAIAYSVYRAVKGTWFEMVWLWAASYVFYGWWNPLYLLLILYGTLVDYGIVVGMEKWPRRKGWWLAASVVSNIGLLAFFKYSRFIAENLNALLALRGIPYAVPVPGILLPVGISFFTFQSMSYIIDCYRGTVERERSLIRYAAYVSLFTQLVAGPIERASNLLRQLREDRRITWQDAADGLSLFVVGFFKKVALADYLALYVDKVYDKPARFQAPALALATFAFAWQIYFDFSGYTDMARGIARMMGLRLMLNFNNPYLADGLGDFWNRWHISLSTWFKDYVYIPLGGNRHGKFRTYLNMCLTMVLSGVWHGAAWKFLVWGALHAAGRVCTRELERTSFYQRYVPRLAKQLAIFLFVTFAWIFFRARSIGDAWLIISRIATGGWAAAGAFLQAQSVGEAWFIVQRIATAGWAGAAFPALALAMVLALWLYQYVFESRAKRVLELAPVRVGLVVLMVAYLATFSAPTAQKFIYFRF
jgi:D-alanyl-lipoteichoic acid acyltransferase DltB (MBOAT superfamily)